MSASYIEDILKKPNPYGKINSAKDRLYPETFPAVHPNFYIEPSDKIFCIGSCFARNVEQHLSRMGFNTPSLQFAAPRAEYSGDTPNSIVNKYTPPAIFRKSNSTTI